MTVLSADARRMVAELRLAYVGTVSPDGFPHLSPKGSLRCWGEDHLVWADIGSAKTVENLMHDPRTEIVLVDPFRRLGYRFRGVSTVLRSGRVFEGALDGYRAEGADCSRVHALVLTQVDSVVPLVSPAYQQGFDEVVLARLWEEYYTKAFEKTVVGLIPPHEF